MPLKTVALVAALCVTTGWVLASLLTPPRASLQMLPERRPARAAAEAPPPSVEMLEWRLRQQPPPPTPRRNPFVFGARRAGATGDRAVPTPEAPVVDAAVAFAPPAPAGPVLTLVGMAANDGADGPVHTAVVSDGRTVHLVKLGDRVAGYAVVGIDATSVTLAGADDDRRVLRLTP